MAFQRYRTLLLAVMLIVVLIMVIQIFILDRKSNSHTMAISITHSHTNSSTISHTILIAAKLTVILVLRVSLQKHVLARNICYLLCFPYTSIIRIKARLPNARHSYRSQGAQGIRAGPGGIDSDCNREDSGGGIDACMLR